MNRAYLQLHLAVFLAGFTAILGHMIDLNEGVLVWYRLFFSIIILGGWMLVRKKIQKINWQEFLKIAGVGTVLAFHWVTFYGAVKYANASVAVVCISAAGFFSALLEPFFFRKKVSFIELALGVLSMAGVYLIFEFHPHFQTGILFGMLAALGSAIFPIFNKELLHKHSAEVLTLYEFVGGLMGLTLLLPLYFFVSPAESWTFSLTDLIWLLVMAAFCTVAAFDLQMNALKKISAFTVNLTYNLEPVYGVAMAIIFLNEHEMLTIHFFVGIAIIVFSIALQMLHLRRKKS